MRISLIDVDPYTGRKTYENLGLGTIAAVLRSNGHSVQLFKLYASTAHPDALETATRHIGDFRPSLVGATAYNTNIKIINTLYRTIKRSNPETVTLVGGVFATMNAQDILDDNPFIDCVVRGEGEDAVLEIGERVVHSSPPDLSGVEGVWWRRGDTVEHNADRAILRDLNVNPEPARDIADAHSRKGQFNFTSMMTSRGCYGACSFCSVNTFSRMQSGVRWRGRAIPKVVDEMAALAHGHDIHSIFLQDSSFEDPPAHGKQRIRQLCEEIIERELRLFLRFESRAESWGKEDAELLRLMRRAGFCYVVVGMESGSNEILKVYNKRARKTDNARCYHMFADHDIFVYPSFIMFQPYATFGELRESAALLHSLGKSYRLDLLTARLSVYNKTPIHRRLERDGLIQPHFTYRSEFDYCYQDPRIEHLTLSLGDHWKKTSDYAIRSVDYLMCVGQIFAGSWGLEKPFAELIEIADEAKSVLSANNYAFFLTILDLAEKGWDEGQFDSLLNDLAARNQPHIERVLAVSRMVRSAALDRGWALNSI